MKAMLMRQSRCPKNERLTARLSSATKDHRQAATRLGTATVFALMMRVRTRRCRSRKGESLRELALTPAIQPEEPTETMPAEYQSGWSPGQQGRDRSPRS